MKSSICTYTGFEFEPLRPDPLKICISDIAHALSCMPRFGGHTRRFYSVAQHSVLVSHLCPLGYAAFGLLHDASEAYLLDLPTPIKQLFPEYSYAERQLQAVIFQRFGLQLVDGRLPDAVKAADATALDIEHKQLMPTVSWWPARGLMDVKTLVPLLPAEAEQLFIERYLELTRKGLLADPVMAS